MAILGGPSNPPLNELNYTNLLPESSTYTNLDSYMSYCYFQRLRDITSTASTHVYYINDCMVSTPLTPMISTQTMHV